MTGIDRQALRDAFGSFPTGVTVVTTVDALGQPYGFTANSFSSVSLDPPLLLVCPSRFLSCFPFFENCKHFVVSILAEGQEDVANIFASYKGDRFKETAWRLDPQGVPLIEGTAAHFSCKTERVIPAGDHIILMGEVLDFARSGTRGLGYAAGRYFSLGLEREAASAPSPGRQAIAGAIIDYEDKVLLCETPDGLRPPQVSLEGRVQVRQTLSEYLAKAGLEIVLGKAYSIFDDRNTGAHYTYFQARALNDATGDLGNYVPVSELSTRRFASNAHATMLARYALEGRAQSFALYVGDESGGDIHSFDEGS